jgi:transaldolase
MRIEKCWEVSELELMMVRDMAAELPCTGDSLEEQCRKSGLKDMFPILSDEDRKVLSDDGKIPKLPYWKDRIMKGEIAPDTLLNLAGLASFAHDQAELDQHIGQIISKQKG